MSETSFHTISSVSEELNIPSHVLRFWEKKFDIITPRKSKTGRRYYSNKDLENIKIIKDLLYDKGYTISGALKFLQSNQGNVSNTTSTIDKNLLLNKLDETSNLILKAKEVIGKYL